MKLTYQNILILVGVVVALVIAVVMLRSDDTEESPPTRVHSAAPDSARVGAQARAPIKRAKTRLPAPRPATRPDYEEPKDEGEETPSYAPEEDDDAPAAAQRPNLGPRSPDSDGVKAAIEFDSELLDSCYSMLIAGAAGAGDVRITGEMAQMEDSPVGYARNIEVEVPGLDPEQSANFSQCISTLINRAPFTQPDSPTAFETTLEAR